MVSDIIIGGIIGLAGAIVGGIATYLAERSLETRREKRINNERIYFPLLDDLKRVRDYITNFQSTSLSAWERIHGNSLHYIVPNEIRDELDKLSDTFRNFHFTVYATKEKIREIAKQELLSRKIDKSRPEGVIENNTLFTLPNYWAFIDLTSMFIAETVIRKEDNGFSGSWKIDLEPYKKTLEELKKHFQLEFLTIDEYVNFLYQKIKDDQLFLQVNKQIPEIVAEIDRLSLELENVIK